MSFVYFVIIHSFAITAFQCIQLNVLGGVHAATAVIINVSFLYMVKKFVVLTEEFVHV